jgi:hypothetical protein
MPKPMPMAMSKWCLLRAADALPRPEDVTWYGPDDPAASRHPP